MTQELIIISAGKFGREILSWANEAIARGAPWRIKGFLDDRPDALDRFNYSARIIGQVDTYKIEPNDVFIGAIGDPRKKLEYYTPIIQRGGTFVNLIHPLAHLGDNVRLGTGIVLAPFASVTCDAVIGDHAAVGCFSNFGHDVVIGNWCQISTHCAINGNAVLEEGVFLGSHACVIPQMRIGAWSFVAAGAVVMKPVGPGLKVFGNPAISIGKTN